MRRRRHGLMGGYSLAEVVALGLTGGGSIQWDLLDRFNSGTWPSGSGVRTCDGVGTITTVDTASKLSLSAGRVDVAGLTVSQSDPRFYGTDSFTREVGRALIATIRVSTGIASRCRTGWRDLSLSPNLYALLLANGIKLFILDSVGFDGAFNISPDVDYPIAIVLRSTGAKYYVKVSGVWRLAWVSITSTISPLFAINAIDTVDQPYDLDMFGVRQLPTPFDTEFGTSTFHDTSVASDDTFTGTADHLTDFAFTLSGSPSANDEIILRTRRQDNDNCWKTYVKRNAGNTAWDFLVDTVSAGTPTNRITVTGVGTPNHIREIADGSLHDFYTRETNWAKRGSQVNIAHLDTETGMNVSAAAGTTLTSVTSDPMESATYDEFDRGL